MAEGAQQGEESKEANRTQSEYWPFLVFGTRLKITDSLLALFTFFSVLVAGGQAWLLYRTDQATHIAAEAAKQSADVARKILTATQRPWIIGAVKIDGLLDLRMSPRPGATVTTTLKNIGNMPATNIRFVTSWKPLEKNAVPMLEGMLPECGVEARSQGGTISELRRFDPSYVLFPNEHVDIFSPVTIDQAMINFIKSKVPAEKIVLMFAICISYDSPSDAVRHYTGDAFVLSKGGKPFTPFSESAIVIDKLDFQRPPLFDGVAE
jgi:hypothetical protein